MPKFFFNVQDTHRRTDDNVGLDLPDRSAAREAAISSLAPIASDGISDSDNYQVMVVVRDEQDATILTASLKLQVEYG